MTDYCLVVAAVVVGFIVNVEISSSSSSDKCSLSSFKMHRFDCKSFRWRLLLFALLFLSLSQDPSCETRMSHNIPESL